MLRFKMIEFEAGNARNSRAIAKFSNEEIGHFGLKLIVHVLIRGSLGNALHYTKNLVCGRGAC